MNDRAVDDRSRDDHETSILGAMTTPRFEPALETQADVEEAWSELMGPWSFGGHSVWMMLIEGDRPLPQLTEVTETEDAPDAVLTERMAQILSLIDLEVAPGVRVAFLRSRPGVDKITDVDRAWATCLYAAARRASVPCEVVHLATRGSVRPIPADVVGLRTAPP